jgi:hypothetical protein
MNSFFSSHSVAARHFGIYFTYHKIYILPGNAGGNFAVESIDKKSPEPFHDGE